MTYNPGSSSIMYSRLNTAPAEDFGPSERTTVREMHEGFGEMVAAVGAD